MNILSGVGVKKQERNLRLDEQKKLVSERDDVRFVDPVSVLHTGEVIHRARHQVAIREKPNKSILARRGIEHCNLQTLHGGVSASVSKVKEKLRIPKHRSTVKPRRQDYNYYAKHRVKVFGTQNTSALSGFQTSRHSCVDS